jgi:hypothetical protein
MATAASSGATSSADRERVDLAHRDAADDQQRQQDHPGDTNRREVHQPSPHCIRPPAGRSRRWRPPGRHADEVLLGVGGQVGVEQRVEARQRSTMHTA